FHRPLHLPRLPPLPTRRSSDLYRPVSVLNLPLRVAGVQDGDPSPCAKRGIERRPQSRFAKRLDQAFDSTLLHQTRTVGFLAVRRDRKSTRLNSSHQIISYAVFC